MVDTLTARVGISSLMPLDRFLSELKERNVEVLEVLDDPSEHRYAGKVLLVRVPTMNARDLRHLLGDAKVAALDYLTPVAVGECVAA